MQNLVVSQESPNPACEFAGLHFFGLRNSGNFRAMCNFLKFSNYRKPKNDIRYNGSKGSKTHQKNLYAKDLINTKNRGLGLCRTNLESFMGSLGGHTRKLTSERPKVGKIQVLEKDNKIVNFIMTSMVGAKETGVDCKNFWEQTFASFLEWNFGLEFSDPRGIWRIRLITAGICRICQICPATLNIKLNCNF